MKVLRNTEGQTLVEFALIISLLLVLLFGITEFGRGWYYSNALVNGARAGARYASELKTPDPNYETKVHDYTFGQISSGQIPVRKNTNTFVSVSAFSKSSSYKDAISNPKNVSKGDAVQVIVRYDFDILTGSIIPFFSGRKQIVRKATMYYEGN